MSPLLTASTKVGSRRTFFELPLGALTALTEVRCLLERNHLPLNGDPDDNQSVEVRASGKAPTVGITAVPIDSVASGAFQRVILKRTHLPTGCQAASDLC